MDLIAHRKSTKHKNKEAIKINDQVEKISSAFICRITSYRIRNNVSQERLVVNNILCHNETSITTVTILMSSFHQIGE